MSVQSHDSEEKSLENIVEAYAIVPNSFLLLSYFETRLAKINVETN